MVPEDACKCLNEAWSLGCEDVQFGGIGEPTLHPEFYQFLSWAKKIGYSINFYTNGWLLDPKKLEILDRGDFIRISIDTMHLLGSPNPGEYINRMTSVFAESKRRKYRISAIAHGEVNSDINSFFADNQIEVFTYPLLKSIVTHSPQKQGSFIRCIIPYRTIAIDADLKVKGCSCSPLPVVGQISELRSLHDIWTGDEMKKFRQEIISENPPQYCRTCDRIDRSVRDWTKAFLRLH